MSPALYQPHPGYLFLLWLLPLPRLFCRAQGNRLAVANLPGEHTDIGGLAQGRIPLYLINPGAELLAQGRGLRQQATHSVQQGLYPQAILRGPAYRGI